MKLPTDKAPLILFIITLAGAWLRAHNLDFGFPLLNCRPDEGILFEKCLKIIAGDPDPQWYRHPSLSLYMYSAVYFLKFLWNLSLGHCDSLAHFIIQASAEPHTLIITQRWITVICSTLCIPVLYAIGLFFFSTKTSLIGTFFFASCYLLIRNSHFGVSDFPTLLITLMALLFLLKYQKNRSWHHGMNTAIFAGLSFSLKYYGILLLPLFFIIIATTEQNKAKRYQAMAITVLIFIGSVVCTMPFAFLNFSQFLTDLDALDSYFNEFSGLKQGSAWLYHLHTTLPASLSLPLSILSAIGFILLAFKNTKESWIFLVFPMLYFIIAGRGNVIFFHHMIPIIPFACLAAAHTLTSFECRFLNHTSLFSRRVSLLLMVAALVLQPLIRSFHFNALIDKADNRWLVRNWIHANIPHGSLIAQITRHWGTVELGYEIIDRNKLKAWRIPRDKNIIHRRALWDAIELEGVNSSPWHKVRYEKGQFFMDMSYFQDGQYITPRQEIPTGPHYLVIAESSLKAFSHFPPGLNQWIDSHYTLKKTFISHDMNVRRLYDINDEFYMPFYGFESMSRPGPNYRIYQHRSLIIP